MGQVKNKVRGEYTYPSDFSEIPDGGLIDSLNVNVDRDSIAEPRRGMNTYKAFSATAEDRGKQLLEFQDTLIANYGSSLSRDGSNPFTAISGTYETPDFGGAYRPKMKSIEANQNFYFTSKSGIKKMTGIATTPVNAGAPRGLDMTLSLAGTPGFMPDDSQVAYRIIWGYKDANNNLILGAPSGRYVIANEAGNTQDVTINATIPSGVTTSWFYQLYRSAATETADIEPNDELQLVIEDNPTSAQITSGFIEVTDSTPEDLRGAIIYTASSQQGIAQANDMPPAGKDICAFRNMGIIANTIQKQSFALTLLSVGGDAGVRYEQEDGDTTNASATVINMASTDPLRAGMAVYGAGIPVGTTILSVDSATQITLSANATSTAAANPLHFMDRLVVNSVSYEAFARQQSSSTVTITIASPGVVSWNSHGLQNGDTVLFQTTGTLPTGITAGTTYFVVSAGANDFQIAATFGGASINTTGTQSGTHTAYGNPRRFLYDDSGTPAQNIATVSQSLIRTINRYPLNTAVYAYYDSSFTELPGQIFLQARSLGASSFNTQAFGHTGAWSPTISTAQASTAEEARNRLYVSKVQQYEAYPMAQYFNVGAADKEILRVIPLREVFIICKEDGFWRGVGDTPATLQIEPVDLTTYLVSPETAQPLANQIYGFTTQGFSSINDTGVGVISRSIEDQINPLYQFANIQSVPFAVPYETDRAYLCWMPESGSDEFPSIVHRYNVFTQEWTKWAMPARAALVNPADDKLYIMASASNNVIQERKDRSYTDYCDEDISVTIAAVDDVTITLDALVTTISVGDAIIQGDLPYSIITDVDNSDVVTVLTVNVAREFSNASATIKQSYQAFATWAPQFAGNPGLMKQFREIQVLFKAAAFFNATLKFTTDLKTSVEELEVPSYGSTLWGYFPWGMAPWGGFDDVSKIRALIPGEYQRCSWIGTTFQTEEAFAYFELAGAQYTFEALSERTQVG